MRLQPPDDPAGFQPTLPPFLRSETRHADDLGRQATLLRRHQPPQLPADRRVRGRASRSPTCSASAPPRTRPSSGRRNKSAIMIYLPGGPSHMDMYDLKPDAPTEFRGEFKPIETNVPGVQICEHLPLQARMFDKLAVVRSLVSVDEHSRLARHDRLQREQVNRTAQHPSFGSVMSQAPQRRHERRPAVRQPARRRQLGTEPGYLGVAHRPFTPSGPGLENLRLANGINGRPHGRPQGRCSASSTPSAATSTPRGTMKRHGRLHRPGLRHDRLRRGPQGARPEERRPARPATATRASSSSSRPAGWSRPASAASRCSYGGWDTHCRNFKELKRHAAEPRPRHRQPDPGPARPRHGGRRGDGGVGRVRPHAEDQQHRRRPRPLGAGDVARWSPAAG